MTGEPALSTRLSNLRLPLFVAPMFLVSSPELVVAAACAGVVGSFPSPNARTPAMLDEWLGRITDQLAVARPGQRPIAPWAVNLVTHSTNKRLPADLKLVTEYQPPIVITALGSPAPVVAPVQAYGGLVFADVINLTYARKAAATGVDGLVLVCSGAGGHTGQLCNFAFLSAVREFFDGYIILAGGISNGRSILGAQAMGADFAYMGTRFIAVEESLADDEYKDMLIRCTVDDLVLTRAFTGALASMMKPSLIKQGLDPEEIKDKTAKMNFSGRDGEKVKPWKGILSAGQGLGAVREVLSTQQLVAHLEEEYVAAQAHFLRCLPAAPAGIDRS